MASRDWWPLFASAQRSRKLRRASDAAYRFWTMLGTACDSWGRIAYEDPSDLESRVWPGLGRGPAVTEQCVDELERLGLISVYEGADGRCYIAFGSWEGHAGALGHPERRGLSQCPDPPGFVAPTAWRAARKRSSPWAGAESQLRDHSGVSPDYSRSEANSGTTPESVRTTPGVGSSPDLVRGDRGDISKKAPQSLLQDSRGPVLPAGARPRPARAGRAPTLPPPASSAGKRPKSCPHCGGVLALQVQPYPAPAHCELHPDHATAGVIAPVCRDKSRPACRTYVGPSEPFGPRPCALCAAKAAVPRATSEAAT